MATFELEEEMLVFQEGEIDFDFNLDAEYVEGLDKVEERVENKMNRIILEELEKVCFKCGFDKLMGEGSYYCPKCEE